ncbi:MAG: neutral/alkaline non-lysosomal ceramidase N-terminal domain-containing protein [Bacteroidales bacterium]
MKHIILIFFAFILLQCNNKNGKHDLMVGVSQASITPDTGAFIAGDKINRRFTGVHDSLYVRVLVVSDTKNHLALLSFDCIGVLYPTLQEIRKEVALKIPSTEFDPSHIVMSSTHTHEGPDVVGIWGPDQMTSGVDSLYIKKLVQNSVNAIVEAWHNRKPATMVYAGTEFGKDWVYNISDSLNLDRSLTVLQFLGTDGKSLATLTNFACHPTIMDGATSLVSADYIAGLYAHLNKNLGGINIFLQGSIGGWVQAEYEPKTFETADKRGRELGRAVEASLINPKKMEPSGIDFKSLIFNLPVSNPGFQQLAAAGVIKRTMTDSVETEIAWFSIGNAQFVTHPGETTPTHSKESKKLMIKQGPKFVIGLGMDELGYILTDDFYQPGTKMKHLEYLSGMSVDKVAGNIMMEKIKYLAGQE